MSGKTRNPDQGSAMKPTFTWDMPPTSILVLDKTLKNPTKY